MKILALADEESTYLWDFFEKEKFKGIDLIISCGDLAASYLSFLATLTNIPVLYVHGNHDDRYEQDPPGGCICIEDTIFVYKGVRIMGLGGSMRYNYGINQYTEKEMKSRLRHMRLPLFWRGGIDILVTHAPAYGINDGDDLPHQGFETFREILDKYKPKFFLHGHVHMNYGRKHKRYDVYKDTEIINAYERYVIEIDVE